jgi:tetratricopeptide (TPR) repeat protein
MLGRIYNQRAQCFEKLKRWPDALEDYDRAIDAVPNGRGRAALHANRAQVHHLLGEFMSILLRL